MAHLARLMTPDASLLHPPGLGHRPERRRRPGLAVLGGVTSWRPVSLFDPRKLEVVVRQRAERILRGSMVAILVDDLQASRLPPPP